MRSGFDISTAYQMTSVVFLIMPVLTWLVLREAASKAVVWWCIGGMTLSGALIALGLRMRYENALPFNTAYSLGFFGNLLHFYAVQLERGHAARLWRWTLVTLAVCAVKEFLLRAFPDEKFHFLWAHLSLAAVLLGTWWAATRLAKSEALKSPMWMATIMLVGGVVYALRFVAGATGLANPDGLHNDAIGIANVVMIIFIAIISNVAVVGLYFERAKKRNLELLFNEKQTSMTAERTIQIAAIDRQRSMGELSAALAHELGQPITSIVLNATCLQQELERKNPKWSELAIITKDITTQAARASQILQGIQGFIKPNKATVQVVNLAQVVANVQTMLAPISRKIDVEFRVHCSSPRPEIKGDEAQLSQVFLNLFRNSFQARPQGERLLIDVLIEAQGEQYKVVVEDNGIGMNDEQLRQYGAPFFTTKENGIGIGIAISKRVVEFHGGTIHAEKASKGSGICTVMSFPIPEAKHMA